MVNKDLNSTEKILVKVDQNNLVYVDPNSVLRDGIVEPRSIDQEKLVMYINLEADLVPRSYLLSDTDSTRYTSIVNQTFSLLSQQNGNDLNTDWTESYNPDFARATASNKTLNFQKKDFNDASGQSFGVESISIMIKGGNFIPRIDINFIDVRGKTLFEQPNDSPYNTFFHLPWPIFYLTIKGYYGKAIRYRLHLVKFSSKYNESNGNFEISTSFIGSTFAYLNDIPLNGIINAPYLYSNATERTKTWNPEKAVYTQEVKRSSKGYLMLSSVYAEMKRKNIIPKDFPVITLRELEIMAMSLDKILEKTIFDQVIDPKILAKIEEYNKAIIDFIQTIQAWVDQYINMNGFGVYLEENYFFFKLVSDANSTVKLVGKDKTGTLENILLNKGDELKKIAREINQAEIAQKDGKYKIKTNFSIKQLESPENYYGKTLNTGNNQYQWGVKVDKLIGDLYNIQNLFFEESSKIMKELEKNINTIVKDKNKGGLGFDPTIRNVFAILMANAEVYVRMTKDVHARAFNVGNDRKGLLTPFDKETKGVAGSVFPWPEVRKEIPGTRAQVIAYPGDLQLRKKLKSDNKNLWPEVEFIEQYIKFTTKVDGVEKVDYQFSNNDENKTYNKISTLFDSLNTVPYTNRDLPSFIYEIFERGKQLTLVDSFTSTSLQEMAEVEFQNLKTILETEIDIVDVLKNNVKSILDLLGLMKKFSEFEKYPYYQDSIPTTSYINDILNEPFSIEKYTPPTKKVDVGNYPSFTDNLNTYIPEPYRRKVFPFSSDTYLGYLNKSDYSLNNFNFNLVFSLEGASGFVTSPIKPKMWVKDGYETNLFKRNLKVGNNYTNILNTPYFHNQLFTDFNRVVTPFGKYAGSAYLLLNSLPFKELEDLMETNKDIKDVVELRMASMFKEIGATHFIPYFLALKWGSIYHRYKNYIRNNVDILSGCTTSNITIPIDGQEFFDNNHNYYYTISGSSYVVYNINYSGYTNVGVHPFYDAIYHQIVNGYATHDISNDPDAFNDAVLNKQLLYTNSVFNNINHWSAFADNSTFVSTDNFYTILPSFGYSDFGSDVSLKKKTFDDEYQDSFRIILDNEEIINSFSGVTFPSYAEHMIGIDGQYSIDSNNRKVIDLIGTFSPSIMDNFEEIFLFFASEQLNEQVPQEKFQNLPYSSFQSLLSDIVRIEAFDIPTGTTDNNEIQKNLYSGQQGNLERITGNIINNKNLLKVTLGNPKELNSYIFEGFTGIAPNSTLVFNGYNVSQLTPDTEDLIKLYIGEYPDTGTNYYEKFFESMDVELTEDNILNFRPLILIYGGYIKDGNPDTYHDFKDYIIKSVYTHSNSGTKGANRRLGFYLDSLIRKFSGLNSTKNYESNIEFYGGYNDEGLKVELYNYFKSFNDKWASGNSLGQNLLMEDFMFLDKANRDIGNRGYINLDRILSLLADENANKNLYDAVSILIQGSGFDMRALPAYVNFYGKDLSSKTRITPSTTVAENLFGTFLDVDYEESEPKIIIQYVEGPLSKHPDITNNNTNMFNDDSFDMSDNNNNPIIITDPDAFTVETLLKSNRAVAFEVSFGDQNQGIFKGVTLDQNSLRNTTESFGVLENLARSESGAGVFNVDTSLFDYYRQASYTCEVSCLGNVMIQPTMFFYLKNIPMFRGSFWITEVNHSIKNNTINTSFKGTRIPRASLPDPIDSFVASFRPIMDKIIQKAANTIKKQQFVNTTTEQTVITDSGEYLIDPGPKLQFNEEFILNKAGVTNYGIPYNGFGGEKDIQLVYYGSKKTFENIWFRTRVALMRSTTDSVKINQIDDDIDMNILCNIQRQDVPINPSSIKWKELKTITKTNNFYSSKFMLSIKPNTETVISERTVTFFNPLSSSGFKKVIVKPTYELDRTVNPINVEGAVSVGPFESGYGIGMSEHLIKQLNLKDGDVVYFKYDDMEDLKDRK